MKRPSFQFYPADWKNNSKLRRCTPAARGAWVDVLCLLHDSDEYGICRWPLDELALSAGVPIKLVKELVAKDVLKGASKNAAPYIFTPRHAGKNGVPVTLVTAGDQPCWYCSRFVRDEWIRQRRGQSTQFSADNQPPKNQPKTTPNGTPNPPFGERQGDGPTSPSTSTLKPSSAVLTSNNIELEEWWKGAPLPDEEIQEPSTDPAVIMAVALRKLQVSVTYLHPAVVDWVSKGVAVKMLSDVVALIRMRPGKETGPINPNYLATVLADIQNPKASRSLPPAQEPKQWWESNKGIEAKGTELGLVNDDDIFAYYRDRVFAAAGPGPWNEKARGSTSSQGFVSAAKAVL